MPPDQPESSPPLLRRWTLLVPGLILGAVGIVQLLQLVAPQSDYSFDHQRETVRDIILLAGPLVALVLGVSRPAGHASLSTSRPLPGKRSRAHGSC